MTHSASEWRHVMQSDDDDQLQPGNKKQRFRTTTTATNRQLHIVALFHLIHNISTTRFDSEHTALARPLALCAKLTESGFALSFSIDLPRHINRNTELEFPIPVPIPRNHKRFDFCGDRWSNWNVGSTAHARIHARARTFACALLIDGRQCVMAKDARTHVLLEA